MVSIARPETHRNGPISHGLAIGVLILVGCGAGGPAAGPSPLTAPPPGTVSAATFARALPSGLDPAYVRALAVISPDGQPKRWEGGPFRHCFSLDPSQVELAEAAAARMGDASGIARTEQGPCNVEWITDRETGHTYANLMGTSQRILAATIHVHEGDRAGTFLHEGGHVLGLDHSPRAGDLMFATSPPRDDFTVDELAVLAWIYGR